jgi:hypothetical protein
MSRPAGGIADRLQETSYSSLLGLQRMNAARAEKFQAVAAP